ncbi:MAG: midcut-by-XrtH protein [Rudaea sp.]
MTSPAWAGFSGTLAYAPAATTTTSTPTLGAWMLLLLALLLAVVAYRVLRSRISGRQMGLFALAGSLIAGGAASGDLIRAAQAVIPAVYMSSATGGTANLGVGIQQVTNTSGVPQQITALTVTTNGDTFVNPGGSYVPQCVVGIVVAPNGSCYVDLVTPG